MRVIRATLMFTAVVTIWTFQVLLFPRVNSPLPWERHRAVERITDQPVLAHVAANDSNDNVRLLAVEKLTDQNALAHAAIMSSDETIVLAIVNKLSDQNALAQVALSFSRPHIIPAIFAKLFDQDMIADIALSHTAQYVREMAVDKLTDQDALIQVALHAESPLLSAIAAGKVTDQAFVTQLALNGSQSFSISKLSDIHGLIEVATNGQYENYCVDAVMKLSEHDCLLASQQTTDTHRRELLLAFGKLLHTADGIPSEHRNRIIRSLVPAADVYSHPAWTSIFGSLQALSVSWDHISHDYRSYDGSSYSTINGEKIILTATFDGATHPLITYWATEFPDSFSGSPGSRWHPAKVDGHAAYLPWLQGNQASLNTLACTSRFYTIRHDIIHTMTDQTQLAHIAINTKYTSTRLQAVMQLTDPAALDSVANMSEDRSVRELALERSALFR